MSDDGGGDLRGPRRLLFAGVVSLLALKTLSVLVRNRQLQEVNHLVRQIASAAAEAKRGDGREESPPTHTLERKEEDEEDGEERLARLRAPLTNSTVVMPVASFSKASVVLQPQTPLNVADGETQDHVHTDVPASASPPIIHKSPLLRAPEQNGHGAEDMRIVPPDISKKGSSSTTAFTPDGQPKDCTAHVLSDSRGANAVMLSAAALNSLPLVVPASDKAPNTNASPQHKSNGSIVITGVHVVGAAPSPPTTQLLARLPCGHAGIESRTPQKQREKGEPSDPLRVVLSPTTSVPGCATETNGGEPNRRNEEGGEGSNTSFAASTSPSVNGQASVVSVAHDDSTQVDHETVESEEENSAQLCTSASLSHMRSPFTADATVVMVYPADDEAIESSAPWSDVRAEEVRSTGDARWTDDGDARAAQYGMRSTQENKASAFQAALAAALTEVAAEAPEEPPKEGAHTQHHTAAAMWTTRSTKWGGAAEGGLGVHNTADQPATPTVVLLSGTAVHVTATMRASELSHASADTRHEGTTPLAPATSAITRQASLSPPPAPNVVHLFLQPRWALAPSLSPPCTKWETFLRLHRIPYEVHEVFVLRSTPSLAGNADLPQQERQRRRGGSTSASGSPEREADGDDADALFVRVLTEKSGTEKVWQSVQDALRRVLPVRLQPHEAQTSYPLPFLVAGAAVITGSFDVMVEALMARGLVRPFVSSRRRGPDGQKAREDATEHEAVLAEGVSATPTPSSSPRLIPYTAEEQRAIGQTIERAAAYTLRLLYEVGFLLEGSSVYCHYAAPVLNGTELRGWDVLHMRRWLLYAWLAVPLLSSVKADVWKGLRGHELGGLTRPQLYESLHRDLVSLEQLLLASASLVDATHAEGVPTAKRKEGDAVGSARDEDGEAREINFLLGREPGPSDCSLYAYLLPILRLTPADIARIGNPNFAYIYESRIFRGFVERMSQEAFPDLEQLLAPSSAPREPHLHSTRAYRIGTSTLACLTSTYAWVRLHAVHGGGSVETQSPTRAILPVQHGLCLLRSSSPVQHVKAMLQPLLAMFRQLLTASATTLTSTASSCVRGDGAAATTASAAAAPTGTKRSTSSVLASARPRSVPTDDLSSSAEDEVGSTVHIRAAYPCETAFPSVTVRLEEGARMGDDVAEGEEEEKGAAEIEAAPRLFLGTTRTTTSSSEKTEAARSPLPPIFSSVPAAVMPRSPPPTSETTASAAGGSAAVVEGTARSPVHAATAEAVVDGKESDVAPAGGAALEEAAASVGVADATTPAVVLESLPVDRGDVVLTEPSVAPAVEATAQSDGGTLRDAVETATHSNPLTALTERLPTATLDAPTTTIATISSDLRDDALGAIGVSDANTDAISAPFLLVKIPLAKVDRTAVYSTAPSPRSGMPYPVLPRAGAPRAPAAKAVIARSLTPPPMSAVADLSTASPDVANTSAAVDHGPRLEADLVTAARPTTSKPLRSVVAIAASLRVSNESKGRDDEQEKDGEGSDSASETTSSEVDAGSSTANSRTGLGRDSGAPLSFSRSSSTPSTTTQHQQQQQRPSGLSPGLYTTTVHRKIYIHDDLVHPSWKVEPQRRRASLSTTPHRRPMSPTEASGERQLIRSRSGSTARRNSATSINANGRSASTAPPGRTTTPLRQHRPSTPGPQPIV